MVSDAANGGTSQSPWVFWMTGCRQALHRCWTASLLSRAGAPINGHTTAAGRRPPRPFSNESTDFGAGWSRTQMSCEGVGGSATRRPLVSQFG